MKFFILFFFCWIIKSSAAQCPVCDSTNNEFKSAQAPKEWLAFIKDPEKINKRKFEYSRRLQVELEISKDGQITGYRFLKVYKTDGLDSDKVEKIIQLSSIWIPAKMCNYPIATKYAVEIYTKPFLIDTTECCRDYFTLVYNNPSFPGGAKAWNQFLQKNIETKIVLNYNETINFCKDAILKFTVNKEGVLIAIEILNEDNLHPLQIKSINSIMHLSTKWIPGETNGRKVIGSVIEIIHFEFLDVAIT